MNCQRILLVVMSIIGLAIMSCEDIVEVPDISNAQVNLLAPQSNAVVTNSVVTFTWEEVEDADDYQLQIATPDFENAVQIVLDSIIVIDSTFVGPRGIQQLSNGNYEWRVRARNSGYNTEYSRNAFSVNSTN